MDKNAAQEQLEELRRHQAEADNEALSEPKGFRIPFLVALWTLVAAGALSGWPSAAVQLVAGVATLGLLIWMVTARKSRMSPERFMKAGAVPTAVMFVAALVVVIGGNIAVRALDLPAGEVWIATAYIVFCIVGFRLSDRATRRALARIS